MIKDIEVHRVVEPILRPYCPTIVYELENGRIKFWYKMHYYYEDFYKEWVVSKETGEMVFQNKPFKDIEKIVDVAIAKSVEIRWKYEDRK